MVKIKKIKATTVNINEYQAGSQGGVKLAFQDGLMEASPDEQRAALLKILSGLQKDVNNENVPEAAKADLEASIKELKKDKPEKVTLLNRLKQFSSVVEGADGVGKKLLGFVTTAGALIGAVSALL